MTAISKYFVSLSFQIPKGEIKKVDNYLLSIDAKLKNFQKNIGKAMELPALKVKKFSFDSLALQRNAQMELNKTSRLLELKITNFHIDQNALNHKMQTSMQRAANQAKISTKFITGNSGGYGVFDVHNKQALSNYANQMHKPMNLPQMRSMSSGVGLGEAGLGIGAASLLGGAAVALPLAAAAGSVMGTKAMYAGNKDAVSNRNLIANVVSNPKLSNEANEAQGKKAFDYLYEVSNKLGQDAKSNAEVYAQVLAGGQANGLDLNKSQKLFTQLLEHSTVNHLPQEKLNRLIAASVQMLGKGQVYSEELKGQMAEASPTLPAFFAKAWAEKTKSGNDGAKATKDLYDAMKDGKVKVDTMMRAFELASAAAQPNIERSSQTSQSEANRLANKRSYLMNEASIQSVEDGFYRINKALNLFADDLSPTASKLAVKFGEMLGGGADLALGVRGVVKGDKDGWQMVKDNIGYLPQVAIPKFMLNHSLPGTIYNKFIKDDESNNQLGLMAPLPSSNPDWLKGFNSLPAPVVPQGKGFASPVKDDVFTNGLNKFSPTSLEDVLRSNNTNNITTNQSNNITLNISSPATNAGELANDLEPHINEIFRRNSQQQISEALQMMPKP